MISRPNPTFVINQKIKELNKHKRRLKNHWHKYSRMEDELKKSAPTYGNEFDYSSEYGHEDQLKIDGYHNEVMHAIDKVMNIDGERRYLQSIIRSAKDKKFKIANFGRSYT